MEINIEVVAESLGMDICEYANYLQLRVNALEKALKEAREVSVSIEKNSSNLKAILNDVAFDKPIHNKTY